MIDLRPSACPISGLTRARCVFAYQEPPAGEMAFRRADGQAYYREIWQFETSKHFVSRHTMEVATDYTGEYVNATYADGVGMGLAFERIIALPAEKSDNAGRIRRLRSFVEARYGAGRSIDLLDVGSGLGVFPYVVKQSGWRCVALDPDPRAVQHIQQKIGVRAACGNFMSVSDLGSFDVITFNKVLEHVNDPVGMLDRAHNFLREDGLVYVELPDGEMAASDGFGREEFFIEHLHIFSFASVVLLADRAGFTPITVERLREPSGKYTLRAFLVPISSNKDPGA